MFPKLDLVNVPAVLINPGALGNRECANIRAVIWTIRRGITKACLILLLWLLRCSKTNTSVLWRAEAVKTSGVVRPLGIAEIGRAAGEDVRAHRRPSVVG